MASETYRELTGDQVRHFLERGYVVLEQVLARELAEQWRSFAFERLGYDPDDPATWAEERIHMPTMNRRRVAEVAPRAWAGICDLVGGEERIKNATDYSYGDGFIVNFGLGAGEAWQPPSPAVHVTLAEPMHFNRDEPAEYSLIELAVLRARGAERLDFRPTAPRERVVPEREARQARMPAEQERCLGIA